MGVVYLARWPRAVDVRTGLLCVARVLLGHGLHGRGADEIHRLAEIGLEEQVHVGELVGDGCVEVLGKGAVEE